MLATFQEKDFDDCVRLFVAAFHAPPLNYDWLTEEKAVRYLRDLTNKPGFLGFTYRFGEPLPAFCFGAIDDYFLVNQFKIDELAVSPNYHRQGAGSEMLLAVEAHLSQRGVCYVYLHTLRSFPAHDFYLKNGYASVEENALLAKNILLSRRNPAKPLAGFF